MNAETRAHLKALIDAEQRRRTAFTPKSSCAECGGHFDDITPDCARCRDRHRQRRKEAAA